MSIEIIHKITKHPLFRNKRNPLVRSVKRSGFYVEYIPNEDFRPFPGVWYSRTDERPKYTLYCNNCIALVLMSKVDHVSFSRLFHISPGSMQAESSKVFLQSLLTHAIESFRTYNVERWKIAVFIIGEDANNKTFVSKIKEILDSLNLTSKIIRKGIGTHTTDVYVHSKKKKILINNY